MIYGPSSNFIYSKKAASIIKKVGRKQYFSKPLFTWVVSIIATSQDNEVLMKAVEVLHGVFTFQFQSEYDHSTMIWLVKDLNTLSIVMKVFAANHSEDLQKWTAELLE